MAQLRREIDSLYNPADVFAVSLPQRWLGTPTEQQEVPLSAHLHASHLGPALLTNNLPNIPASHSYFVSLLLFYILGTSKVIVERVPIWENAHSWRLYRAAPLGNQPVSSMTQYPNQSHYNDTEPTIPCPIPIRPNIGLRSDKYQFYKSLVWTDHGVDPTISRTREPYSTDSANAPWSSHALVRTPVSIVVYMWNIEGGK